MDAFRFAYADPTLMMHWSNLLSHDSLKYCAAVVIVVALFVASKGGGDHDREPSMAIALVAVIAAGFMVVAVAVTSGT